MEHFDKEFCLEVSGPWACFTRPELKVERVSYDVITPSAARSIFEAIFWKPAIHWQVTRIEVLNPIRWTSIRRNEVGSVSKTPVVIEEKRQQRNSLILKDVRYRLHARMVFIPLRDRKIPDTKNPGIDAEEASLLHQDENPGKYNAIFLRRASKGQCFTQPYLGCREFSADWHLAQDGEQLDQPIDETRDFGIMLYDMDFSDHSGKAEPMFYRARMEHGIIEVPSQSSKEVLK